MSRSLRGRSPARGRSSASLQVSQEIVQLNFGRKSNKNKSKFRKASGKSRKSRKASRKASRKSRKASRKSRKASRKSRKASRKSRKASRKSRKASRKASKRKYTTKKVCNEFLKEKISINMKEFQTRAQALAVSYSQTNKKFPRCSRFFKKSK